jgi:hypothetical protein
MAKETPGWAWWLTGGAVAFLYLWLLAGMSEADSRREQAIRAEADRKRVQTITLEKCPAAEPSLSETVTVVLKPTMTGYEVTGCFRVRQRGYRQS